MSTNLPPALAARLARRGLINNRNQEKSPDDKPTIENKIVEHEEVIAEDYDDAPKQDVIVMKIIDTVRGCPNKYNIYHNCTSYCAKRYANVSEEPPKRLCKQLARLLKQYPLKDSVWEQVYEPALQTYYFWNTETDQVSWLPPNHPKAKISMPAERLRRLIRDEQDESEHETSDKEKESDDGRGEANSDNSDDNSSNESESDSEYSKSDDSDQDDENDEVPKIKRIRMVVERRNKLDPMNPAAYSNISPGNWSDGLR